MEREEGWLPIDEFPGYQVSDYGRIYSELTGTMLRPSINSTGSLKVNLMQDGRTQTRSIRVLVATAFIPNEQISDDTTPINLDGDSWNNHKENLTWRPRWFAWKYMRQFHEPVPPEYNTAVFNILSSIRYATVMHAGIDDGVLWEYIYNSILTGRPVFPTGATYDFSNGIH